MLQVFEGNILEDLCYETLDAGAFYSSGSEATAYTNRGNILRNNTFAHMQMRGGQHSAETDGRGSVFGVPVISGVYLDDSMSDWVVESNSFINCNTAIVL